ncbi:hypothetical protein COBT_000910 [Conglomerata obtusa]
MAQNYTWDQQFDEITINIPLQPSTKPTVELKNSLLTIKTPSETILEKSLTKQVNENELIWYVDDDVLIVQLLKETSEWWDRAFDGDESIDVEEIAKNRPVGLDGMDAETKRMVEKMMYEQKTGVKDDEMKRKLDEMQQQGAFDNNEEHDDSCKESCCDK